MTAGFPFTIWRYVMLTPAGRSLVSIMISDIGWPVGAVNVRLKDWRTPGLRRKEISWKWDLALPVSLGSVLQKFRSRKARRSIRYKSLWSERNSFYLLKCELFLIVPASVLDHLHPSLRVIYVSFRTACPPQSPHGMTADVGVRGGAPGTLWAWLDALVALRVWCETLLFFGLTGNQQHQQQAETVQSHSHPAFRVKLWEDEQEWNDVATHLFHGEDNSL